MKNIKSKILIILIIIISVLVIPVQADLPVGHKQVICFDCHPGRFGIGSEFESDECGNCHMYGSKDSLEGQHNPRTCKVCHGVADSKAFHKTHGNKTCNICHGEIGNAKPTNTINECGGCHSGQIHLIHEEKLDQICATCHGKVPNVEPQQMATGYKISKKLYAKVVDYKQYTLFEIIKQILKWK